MGGDKHFGRGRDGDKPSCALEPRLKVQEEFLSRKLRTEARGARDDATAQHATSDW